MSAALYCVSLFDDAGQNTLFTAANTGATVSLEYRCYDGSGFDLEGQFQSFSLTGSKDQFAETFTGQFRVNELTEVSAGGAFEQGTSRSGKTRQTGRKRAFPGVRRGWKGGRG